jgi:NAD(P)-dependent dehydrogenase (short-subunit alcohol dehydrogenase family)
MTDLNRLSGQVALVTGGGRGFGRAFAIALAAHGMRVAVAARSLDQLEETAERIRSHGGEAIALATDVRDEKAVNLLVEKIEDRFGGIDLLINSAGAGRPYGPTWEIQPSEWWSAMETNMKGPLLCCVAVMRGMVERKRGRIINVASGAGTSSVPYMSAYVTSKAALIRFTEVLADEVRSHGISMFAIQPGTVRTAMAEDLIQSEEGKRWLPWFQEIFDEGRDVTVDPAIELVLYLASGEADALSGRMFVAPGTHVDIVSHAEEVKAGDLHVLRMRYFQRQG